MRYLFVVGLALGVIGCGGSNDEDSWKAVGELLGDPALVAEVQSACDLGEPDRIVDLLVEAGVDADRAATVAAGAC